MDPNACVDGEPQINKEYECMNFHQKKVLRRQQDAQNLGVPLIITEFGYCYDSDSCAMEINLVTEACDEQLVGWAYY
jgi:hypothetical protein